jgi:uncharacterized protein (DUF1697 family)
MTAYAALLRAINVGGTGKLPMAELKALCEKAGFFDVATYIQSGNVVFRSQRGEASVKKRLEQSLAERMGKPVGVHVRTREELEDVLAHNPFGAAPSNRVIVFFLDAPLTSSAVAAIETPGGEEIHPHGRELFIHYPLGQGQSQLKLPVQRTGTGRNLNTVRKLAEMLAALDPS